MILGSTGAINVLLDITIKDSKGNTIKKIETFSDRFGVFKIDNFRIPNDAIVGTWEVFAKSGGNFNSFEFIVSGEKENVSISTDKSNYNQGEMLNIQGDGARQSATVIIKIYDSDGGLVDQLNITATSKGSFATIWKISELEEGEYDILADDGSTNATTTFSIVP